MKFLHQIPFLRLLLFFFIGIIIQSYYPVKEWIVWIVFMFSALFFLLSYLPKFRKNYTYRFLFGCGLALLLFASALILTKQAWQKSEWPEDFTAKRFEVQILNDPVRRPKSWSCDARILATDHPQAASLINKKLRLYIAVDERSNELSAGRHIVFQHHLQAPFDYLKRQSIAASTYLPAKKWMEIEAPKKSFSVQLKALEVRRNLLRQLRQIVPDDNSYALASALMFGYRNELDDDLEEAFRNVGAAHILAISGTHFSILFSIFYFLFSFLGNYRWSQRLKLSILLPFFWFFAFLTGFSPPVVRAVLMPTVWGIGEILGYRSQTLNTVVISAFFMLIFNPLYLFDVGWQLSFLAVIAIIVLNPHLVRLYQSKNLIIKYMWQLSCLSISAQLGVLPLTIYYFHQFPVYFLLGNLLLLPLSSILLFLIPFTMLIFCLSGYYRFLMWPLQQSLSAFIDIVRWLDQLPFRTIEQLNFTFFSACACTLAIVLISLLFIRKRLIYFCLLWIEIVFLAIYYW